MFKKILYPTDLSDVSKKALNCLLAMKSGGVKEVVLLRVISQSNAESLSQYHKHFFPGTHAHLETPGKGVAAFLESVYRAQEEEAREGLAPFEAALKEAHFKVKTRIERGVPQLKILEVEEQENVDAIILGSHGRSNLKEMLLGSVSEHVIRHSRKPVIVIKR
ncbi:universal stress protein [Desulfoferrobacter suflitae]|uniref:universal stress protein n=1 Tax=Desulfoferrobacter suflitae TaxID=2865782 RepID=UPI002164D589|nr:universal stress protein [Desulfoferrobacter suflitae]MCK8603733.1 universal stress protein [Desulfoferrobacter suflitae]